MHKRSIRLTARYVDFAAQFGDGMLSKGKGCDIGYALATSVPAEMVQLIIAARKFHLPDETAIFGGTRLEVNDAHSVALSILADVEQRHISEALWRGLHRHAG
jgi:hypothetical protein